jgi:hypothetical protein
MSLELVHIQQTYTRQETLAPFIQVYDQPASKIKESVTVAATLDAMFPEQEREDKNIQLVRKTLGLLAAEYSTEELIILINEVEFLTESWLDDFERKIFKGLTLQELLHEKGGK